MIGFSNVRAYIRGEGIVRTDIAIKNGIIAETGSIGAITTVAQTGNLLLVPGFIDEHIHGAGGADVMDATKEALDTISQTLVKEGTTSFLATTMTQSGEKIARALKAVAEYRGGAGARVLGAHLEGPFISPEHIGAQPSEFIEKPSVGLFEKFQSAAGGCIKMVTFAPEEEGGAQLLEYLKTQKTVASVGHSNAGEEVIRRGIDCGLACVTHTFNAQSPVHHREIGVAGCALLYGELACEVIADAVHVSVPALKLLINNKPCDKLILITDAIRAKGCGEGVSELGGQTVYVKNNQARLKDGTLAGSVLKMNEAVKNLVKKCGVSVERAIDCATYNPAKNLCIEDRFGVIRFGAAADFTLLDENFNVVMTFVNGQPVYKNSV